MLGLLHDFGKFSQAFQDYMQLIIQQAVSSFDPDIDDVDVKSLKGKIDHSSAGAQWVFQYLLPVALRCFPENGSSDQKLAIAAVQILALCIASHHSGLIDCLPSGNGSGFLNRIRKADDLTHLQECMKSADTEILAKAASSGSADFIKSVVDKLKQHSSEASGHSDVVRVI